MCEGEKYEKEGHDGDEEEENYYDDGKEVKKCAYGKQRL
jgi:hypothetical protein